MVKLGERERLLCVLLSLLSYGARTTVLLVNMGREVSFRSEVNICACGANLYSTLPHSVIGVGGNSWGLMLMNLLQAAALFVPNLDLGISIDCSK